MRQNVNLGLRIADLGWVEFDLWFATVATQCPIRIVEDTKIDANPILAREQMRYSLEHKARSDL